MERSISKATEDNKLILKDLKLVERRNSARRNRILQGTGRGRLETIEMRWRRAGALRRR